MTKIELMRHVAAAGAVTSPEVAEAFDIPLRQASAYLTKNHARGYLSREPHGSGFVYRLSRAGERRLAWDDDGGFERSRGRRS